MSAPEPPGRGDPAGREGGTAERPMTDLELTEALQPGDLCEFRPLWQDYPARREWRAGSVLKNGGSGYWSVKDVETGKPVYGLYIEEVRAPEPQRSWWRRWPTNTDGGSPR